MRTRRSRRSQDILYRSIGQQLAREAREEAAAREADPRFWACPDGPRCKDPECIRIGKELRHER